ncbi:MAG: winged helix-turn-helix transcriptional regulator [Clostridiales bacterium]|nr:winged helix-turn-helix transcriptional regulator [Clostridiales bacterium]
MENTTTSFEVLGDPTRMQILTVLSGNNNMRAKDILEHLNVTQPTLSHHMHLLENEKLVVVKKIGRECFYSIEKDTILSLIVTLQGFLPLKASRNDAYLKSEKLEKDKKDKKDKKKKKKDKKEKSK